MATRFEWDPHKAAANLEKHGVSFDIALRVFADPFALSEKDRVQGGEERWRTLGMVEGQTLLLVATRSTSGTNRDSRTRSSASFPPGGRTRRRNAIMPKKLVKHTVDLTNLPPLSTKQKRELAALARRPGEKIDYSEVPPLDEHFWQHAEVGRFYKPTKTSTTVRIDSDVLAWLRSQGKGYQSRMNAILRREMLEAAQAKSHVA